MDSSLSSARKRRTAEHVLGVLTERGLTTRAELTQLTGLSRSAVGSTVASLLEDGLILEQAPPEEEQSGPGRPATVLVPRRREGIVLALDFGHGHVAVAVANLLGEVLADSTRLLDVDGEPKRALDIAVVMAHEALATAGHDAGDITGIAAGIPGVLDTRTRIVRGPTILSDWIGLCPEVELSRRFGHPVAVANDADMGARGEHTFGAARRLDDFLYIKASHGIGAGLVLAGKTYRGSIGIAGEIGHTTLQGATNLCRCGNRGCLETLVSVDEVRKQLSQVLPPGKLYGNHAELPTLAEIASIPAAARVITDAGRTIGIVLADIVNTLNPAAIVLGGELGSAGGPFAAGVRESIDRYALPVSAEAVTVLTSGLRPSAEILGAVATAMQQPSLAR
ncbi:ROK family transcriptional regulator [Arthrobacter sp. 24S4-2]|uniref:ROK family transcriptional regulator n=1 Tax=Arthrobacter sp. 24S4-2 TaxID=2575374 RepID=UPI0010C7AFC5|nr:ROK family transcriptional regulator [Arthrobacter sp. 24S4-2]QCO96771.1 ROK family transcriptional regulator [Arthrobacter sp. 24S4-2]